MICVDVAIKTHQPEAILSRTVLEVRRFMEIHFVSEENLMRETAYPDVESHRSLHAELLIQLTAMTAKLSVHREFPEDLLSFLNDWLIAHIAGHARDLTRHVRQSSDRPVTESIYAEYLPGVASAAGRSGPDQEHVNTAESRARTPQSAPLVVAVARRSPDCGCALRQGREALAFARHEESSGLFVSGFSLDRHP